MQLIKEKFKFGAHGFIGFESITIIVQCMATGRQGWHWSYSWELTWIHKHETERATWDALWKWTSKSTSSDTPLPPSNLSKHFYQLGSGVRHANLWGRSHSSQHRLCVQDFFLGKTHSTWLASALGSSMLHRNFTHKFEFWFFLQLLVKCIMVIVVICCLGFLKTDSGSKEGFFVPDCSMFISSVLQNFLSQGRL